VLTMPDTTLSGNGEVYRLAIFERGVGIRGQKRRCYAGGRAPCRPPFAMPARIFSVSVIIILLRPRGVFCVFIRYLSRYTRCCRTRPPQHQRGEPRA